MAKFKFKHAVMRAGKSQELARVNYNYKVKGDKTLIIVPSTDNRHGIGKVTARSGEQLNAVAIAPGTMKEFLDEFFESEDQDIIAILVDEVQFFTRQDIFDLKDVVLYRDIPVIAYGLKVDFQNNLFEGSAAALVVAEEVHEIETVCSFCNKMAHMNIRMNNGKPARDGEQVQIGDDEYLQVCHKHWNNPGAK